MNQMKRAWRSGAEWNLIRSIWHLWNSKEIKRMNNKGRYKDPYLQKSLNFGLRNRNALNNTIKWEAQAWVGEIEIEAQLATPPIHALTKTQTQTQQTQKGERWWRWWLWWSRRLWSQFTTLFTKIFITKSQMMITS